MAKEKLISPTPEEATPEITGGDTQEGATPETTGGDAQEEATPETTGGDAQEEATPEITGGDTQEGATPETTGGDAQEGATPETTGGDAQEESISSITDALLERMKAITKPEHIVDAFEHNPTAEELFETSDKQVFLVRQDAVNHSLFLDSKTVKRYKR